MIAPYRTALAGLILCAASAPPSGGTISVEPATSAGQQTPAGIAAGIGDALGARGFTVLDAPGHSALIAEVTLARTEVGTGSAATSSGRAAVAPGLLGAAGGSITVPLAGRRTRSVSLQRIRLDLSIRRRGSGAVMWRGAAVTVRADDGSTTEEPIAETLGAAILRFYPTEPPGVVSVP